MNPQDQQLLTRLTMAAKKIVYDPQRFKVFLKMLGTKDGAIIAVHTVLAVIQKATQVPPELLPQLGVNTYLIMVDVAQSATGHKADPKIVHDVIQQIMSESATQPASASQPAPSPAQSTPPAQGIIGAQMGAQ
jgi:hypothetical protein